jgi:PAS domain S-box-containing protein
VDITQFLDRVDFLGTRAAALRERVGVLPLDQQPVLAGAVADLGTAVEQLEAAAEELLQQAEALTAAEGALMEARQRYQELFELAPIAYVVTDIKGLIRETNQAARTLLNASGRFLEGKSLALFIAKHEQVPFRSRLRQLRQGTQAEGWTAHLQPYHQPARDVAISVAIGRTPAGRPSTLRWLLHDVTERQHLLEEQSRLRRRAEAAEAELRAFLDSAPDSIMITRADGQIVHVSRRTEDLFGYSREELIGREVEILIPERLRAVHRDQRAGYQAAPRVRPMGIGLELVARR